MSDAEKFAEAKEGLKFCPECGEMLRQHPSMIDTLSCFSHGDFLLRWIDGDLFVHWRPLRMARFYINKNKPEILSSQMSELLPLHQAILNIRSRYFNGEFTLLESFKAYSYAQNKEPNPEPSSMELRQFANTVLEPNQEADPQRLMKEFLDPRGITPEDRSD